MAEPMHWTAPPGKRKAWGSGKPRPEPNRRGMPPVPEGWFNYTAFGTPLDDTRIFAMKTPLKEAFNSGRRRRGEVVTDYHGGVPLEEEFTPTQLIERLGAAGLRLGMVVDLTFTDRYYDPSELRSFEVKHIKMKCPGKEVPNDELYARFAAVLTEFLRDSANADSVVAVHCTHGLNRTGYLVCRYLVDHMSYSVEDAIRSFNEARGHEIERENYLEHLRRGCPSSPGRTKPKKHHQQLSEPEPCLYSKGTVVPKSAESRHEKQRRPHRYYKQDKYKHTRDGGIDVKETLSTAYGSHRSHRSHRRTPVGPQYLGGLPEERFERVQRSGSYEQDCRRYCVTSHNSEQLHACTSGARLPRGHWSHGYNPRPQFHYSEHDMQLDSEHRYVYERSHPRVPRHHFDAWTGTD